MGCNGKGIEKGSFIKLMLTLCVWEPFGGGLRGVHRLSDSGCPHLCWKTRDRNGGRRRAGTTSLHPPRPPRAAASPRIPIPCCRRRSSPRCPSRAEPERVPLEGSGSPGSAAAARPAPLRAAVPCPPSFYIFFFFMTTALQIPLTEEPTRVGDDVLGSALASVQQDLLLSQFLFFF